MTIYIYIYIYISFFDFPFRREVLEERQSAVVCEQICDPRKTQKRQPARNARRAKRNAQRGGGWTRKANVGRKRASAIRQRAR
jgi:hypothetical protein